jgi:hypothetical protein
MQFKINTTLGELKEGDEFTLYGKHYNIQEVCVSGHRLCVCATETPKMMLHPSCKVEVCV